MKAITRALVNAMFFIEMAGDGGPDEDSAAKALEMIWYDLRECSAEEKRVLREVLAEERNTQEASGRSPEELAFFDRFLGDFLSE